MLRLEIGDSTEDHMRKAFVPAFRDAFTESPQAFFNLSDDDICSVGSKLACIRYRGEAIAGARALIDGQGTVYVGQCFTKPEHRGFGLIAPVIAELRAAFYREQGVADSRLVVRMIEGKDNAPAVRAYEKIGYVRSGITSSVIFPGDPLSAHLIEKSPDGVLVVRDMTAGPGSISHCEEIIARFEAACHAQRYGIGG